MGDKELDICWRLLEISGNFSCGPDYDYPLLAVETGIDTLSCTDFKDTIRELKGLSFIYRGVSLTEGLCVVQCHCKNEAALWLLQLQVKCNKHFKGCRNDSARVKGCMAVQE